jgi:hypothetical protein
MSEEDLLRRCLHLTMRSYVNGKLDQSKPCFHWECVARNAAADRIEELEAANRGWLDKWERMACEFCGSHMDPDRAELLDALLDTRDPLTRAGVCIFCEQRVGLSVFGSELLNPDRHSKGCAWLNRQLRGAGDE